MRHFPALLRPACGAALFLAAAGSHLLAADSATSDGYRNVKLNNGGKTVTVRVKDTPGPRLKGQTPGAPYNPTNMDLGRTSSFSDKAFSSDATALSKNSTAAESRGGNRFITKSYSGGASSSSSYSKKYQTTSFADSLHGTDNFNKSYPTSGSALAQGKSSSFAGKASEYQGRAAVLNPGKTASASFASTLGDKTFTDPEMTHVRRDPYAAANGLDVARMAGLPSRPLTIDEVRNLINHETVPNLGEKPEPSTPALNDPDYEPPTVAPMAHRTGPPPPEEKDSGLPAPGMMANPPENSEPLPK